MGRAQGVGDGMAVAVAGRRVAVVIGALSISLTGAVAPTVGVGVFSLQAQPGWLNSMVIRTTPLTPNRSEM